MADDLDPAAVIATEEERIRGYVDFDRHRDQCVSEINGMRRALRLLAAAGLLVTPDRPGDAVTSDWDTWVAEHDAQVAARALREAAEAIDGDSFEVIGAPREFHQGMQSAVDRLRRRAGRIERQEGDR